MHVSFELEGGGKDVIIYREGLAGQVDVLWLFKAVELVCIS